MELTLIAVGELESRVRDLVRDAQDAAHRGRHERGWCPTRCFYREFKPRVMELVGFERATPHDGAPVEVTLHRSAAYDVVYWAVYRALHAA